MRKVSTVLCLTILVGASVLFSEETAEIDAAQFIGIRVAAEVEPADPLRVRCTIEWLRTSKSARVSVLGPAMVASAAMAESRVDGTTGWSSAPLQVAPGESHELILALSPDAIGESAVVIAERAEGDVILQAAVDLTFDGASTIASPQASVRVIHDRLEDGRGVITVDHLAPSFPTKATINVSDSNNYPIPDGPTDCSSSSMIWPRTLTLGVNSAPPSAITTAVTVGLEVIHPVMADLQIVFSKEFFTIARYLWLNGAGVNLNQSFTTDVFHHALPGIGESPNGTWVLAIRDCNAGSTGHLDRWSIQIEYDSNPTIDLLADVLTVSPTTVEPGDTVEVEWSGHVAGSGSVGGPFTTSFYLSSDSNITTGDTLLGQVVESSADSPGDTFGETSPGRTLTIPGGTTDGTYYLGMIVDSADVIGETNEGNNTAWFQFDVSTTPPTIDLVADSVSSGSASVVAGDSIQVTYSGHASGAGTISGDFSLGFYLSTDGAINPADQLLTQRVGPWATTGGDTFFSTGFTVPIPASTPPGVYVLGLWVDDTQVVVESNELNNYALYITLSVSSGGGGGQPNLTAMPCSVSPVSRQPGDQTTLTWRAFNTGDADSGSFSWGIYLSTDPGIDPSSDTLLEHQTESSWPPDHDSGLRETTVTLDSGLSGGTYYMGLVLDDGSTVTESAEGDNSCSAQLEIGTAVVQPTVTKWLVPAAASAPGFGTSNWKSQISVVNPHTATRTANLYYIENGAPWPGVLLSGPITIGPTDRAYFDDILATLNPTSGLLYVVLDSAGPVVTSRTYNLEPGGATFGQGIPAIPFEGVSPPKVVVLPMVHSEPGRFHTNLGIVHAAAGSLRVRVSVFNAAGTMIGSKIYAHSQAWKQINNVFSDMGLGSQILYGGWLQVEHLSGTGFWTCYASVVDDLTDDPTYVAPMEVIE